MSEAKFEPPQRSWPAKFRAAGSAMAAALRSQTSFHVHGVMALAVVTAAALLQVSQWEWCVLILCIAIVAAAEMFNTALEILAKAVDHNFNPHLAQALDTSSGAVLLAAIGAATVGAIVFLRRAVLLLGWG
jgi:diacylglycerol kinase